MKKEGVFRGLLVLNVYIINKEYHQMVYLFNLKSAFFIKEVLPVYNRELVVKRSDKYAKNVYFLCKQMHIIVNFT